MKIRVTFSAADIKELITAHLRDILSVAEIDKADIVIEISSPNKELWHSGDFRAIYEGDAS